MAKGARCPEGVGIIEAPRGTLFHHYRVNENDQVVMANLIVSTTNNNEAMNRAVRKVAETDFDGRAITEGLLNHIEVAIRAYDPCLSCATHALGRMPLEVTLEDATGTAISRLSKNSDGNHCLTPLPGDRAYDFSAMNTTNATPRVVVLGWGNVTRSDDALGPLLIERVERAQLRHVTVISEDFQLQIAARPRSSKGTIWCFSSMRASARPGAVRLSSQTAPRGRDMTMSQPQIGARGRARYLLRE